MTEVYEALQDELPETQSPREAGDIELAHGEIVLLLVELEQAL